MKKKDLYAKAGISPVFVTKKSHNGYVTIEIFLKICTVPGCQMEGIMEVVLGGK